MQHGCAVVSTVASQQHLTKPKLSAMLALFASLVPLPQAALCMCQCSTVYCMLYIVISVMLPSTVLEYRGKSVSQMRRCLHVAVSFGAAGHLWTEPGWLFFVVLFCFCFSSCRKVLIVTGAESNVQVQPLFEQTANISSFYYEMCKTAAKRCKKHKT